MNNYTSFSLSLACFIILSLQACKKGDKGDPGPMGNANVIYSEWFTPGSYIKDTVFGIWGFKHDRAVPEITQAVLDSGAILTYAKLKGYNTAVWSTSQVAPMPIQLTYKQGGVTTTDTWSALSTPGQLRIRFVNDDNQYTAISTAHEFRYIIIPGGSKAALSVVPGTHTINGNVSLQQVIGNNQIHYNEVCRKLNIAE